MVKRFGKLTITTQSSSLTDIDSTQSSSLTYGHRLPIGKNANKLQVTVTIISLFQRVQDRAESHDVSNILFLI